MTANLALVRPIEDGPHFMRRVFTEEFATRLEAINRMARELRAMGYRTVSESIGGGDVRPAIEVEPGTQRTAKPLIELGHGRLAETLPDGSRICSITHDGVRVFWREVERKTETV